ncbi:DUF2971 domain-containing protein [Phreatobacter cathodiphilus]|nr:DUF2971 domain-containing protein [Phreatobacter cathodiphilus]
MRDAIREALQMLTAEQKALVRQIQSIFMPTATRKRAEAKDAGRKLVHYTSAANALNIIRNRRVWMRSIYAMNDFREIEHGFDLLNESLTAKKDELFAALDECSVGVGKMTVDLFNSHLPAIRRGTYVACMSEHLPEEDGLGRLSMWRAYGSQIAGTALVINADPMYIEDDIGLMSNPVQYFSQKEAKDEIEEVISNIILNKSMLKDAGQATVMQGLFACFLNMTICTKHPGFAEEREWRIMHLPQLWPSKATERSVEVINGYPQIVYKIIMEDNAEIGLTGVTPDKLIDQVIIGPSRFPLLQYDAMVLELESLGMEDLKEKVRASDIPLRT